MIMKPPPQQSQASLAFGNRKPLRLWLMDLCRHGRYPDLSLSLRMSLVRSVHRMTLFGVGLTLFNVPVLVCLASGIMIPWLPSMEGFSHAFRDLFLYPLPFNSHILFVIFWITLDVYPSAALIWGAVCSHWALAALRARIKWLVEKIEDETGEEEALALQGVMAVSRRNGRLMSSIHVPKRRCTSRALRETIVEEEAGNGGRFMTVDQIRVIHIHICYLIDQVDQLYRQFYTAWIVIGWPLVIYMLKEMVLTDNDTILICFLSFYLGAVIVLQGRSISSEPPMMV